MILHENRLPADDSHEISCLVGYFRKSGKILNCHLLQIIGGALWVTLFNTSDLKKGLCKQSNIEHTDKMTQLDLIHCLPRETLSSGFPTK